MNKNEKKRDIPRNPRQEEVILSVMGGKEGDIIHSIIERKAATDHKCQLCLTMIGSGKQGYSVTVIRDPRSNASVSYEYLCPSCFDTIMVLGTGDDSTRDAYAMFTRPKGFSDNARYIPYPTPGLSMSEVISSAALVPNKLSPDSVEFEAYRARIEQSLGTEARESLLTDECKRMLSSRNTLLDVIGTRYSDEDIYATINKRDKRSPRFPVAVNVKKPIIRF